MASQKSSSCSKAPSSTVHAPACVQDGAPWARDAGRQAETGCHGAHHHCLLLPRLARPLPPCLDSAPCWTLRHPQHKSPWVAR